MPDIAKRRPGRRKIDATPVLVRIHPQQLAALDAWIDQCEPRPSRPEAIRTLLKGALSAVDTTAIGGELE